MLVTIDGNVEEATRLVKRGSLKIAGKVVSLEVLQLRLLTFNSVCA
jgi:hypothetical protein